MKLNLTVLLILGFILTMVMGCGCSLVTAPAYGYTGDDKDVWPIFYGTDNTFKDNGIIVFYDQSATAWDAPVTVDTDLLSGQWTPQRNAIGWNTYGKWNVSFIESTGNDLELWQSPDDQWQDDAGAWAMLDNDASQAWLAVDVETRQNWVWGAVLKTGNLYSSRIDLSIGVPALTIGANIACDNNQYTIVLDTKLYGLTNIWYRDTTDKYGVFLMPALAAQIWDSATTNYNYPQIICDGYDNVWVFSTVANALFPSTYGSPYGTVAFDDHDAIYTATALTDAYHATWLKLDDTIHVILVDTDEGNPNATTLVYLRRDANGWVEEEILLIVDGSGEEFTTITWPQICVDPLGNIFVSYIIDVFEVNADLQGFYLDATLYDNPVAGSWVQHLNIDQGAAIVLWAIMPDSIPVGADM